MHAPKVHSPKVHSPKTQTLRLQKKVSAEPNHRIKAPESTGRYAGRLHNKNL